MVPATSSKCHTPVKEIDVVQTLVANVIGIDFEAYMITQFNRKKGSLWTRG